MADSPEGLLLAAARVGSRDAIDAVLNASELDHRVLEQALFLATEEGHEAAALRLIQHGARGAFVDGSGNGAAHLAAGQEMVSLLEALLTCNHDACRRWNRSGVTPSGVAALEGRDLSVRLVLARDADPEPSALLGLAAMAGHAHTIDVLVQAGQDVNGLDARGRTPLQWAVQQGHLGAMLRLVQLGADPTLKDPDGQTALSLAVVGSPEVAAALLRATPEVDWPAADPEALHLAVLYASEEWVVRALRERGYDPGRADGDGETPVSLADGAGRRDLAATLAKPARRDRRPP